MAAEGSGFSGTSRQTSPPCQPPRAACLPRAPATVGSSELGGVGWDPDETSGGHGDRTGPSTPGRVTRLRRVPGLQVSCGSRRPPRPSAACSRQPRRVPAGPEGFPAPASGRRRREGGCLSRDDGRCKRSPRTPAPRPPRLPQPGDDPWTVGSARVSQVGVKSPNPSRSPRAHRGGARGVGGRSGQLRLRDGPRARGGEHRPGRVHSGSVPPGSPTAHRSPQPSQEAPGEPGDAVVP